MSQGIRIFYEDFINSATVSHNDSIDTYYDGIKHLIKSKSDIISYNIIKTDTNIYTDGMCGRI